MHDVPMTLMFSAATELSCSMGDITEPGLFSSPGYREDGTGYYTTNLNCAWRINPGIGNVRVNHVFVFL